MNQSIWKVSQHLPFAQGEVLLGLANGLTNKEIARQRGVSPSTINSILTQIREKLSGKLVATGKRAWIVAEAIHRGWLSPLMVMICISSVLGSMMDTDIEMRRTSNRLTASRMVRAKRGREAHTLDFDFDEMTPDSLLAFFEMTPSKTNTLAPWTSTAWKQCDLLTSDYLKQMWRSRFDSIS